MVIEKMGIMEEIKNEVVVKELWDLHRELVEEKDRLCIELDTTGKTEIHHKIDGIDTAISRIERRIIERQGRL